MTDFDVDVVIAGGGPTGLMLAIELAAAGVSARIVERRDELDETIKAGAIGALAAEALVRRGLGPAIEAEELAMGQAAAEMMKRSGGPAAAPPWHRIGGHFAGLFLIDQIRQREPERRLRGVRQLPLERMLNELAQALGVDLRRGVELIDFVDEGGGVTVTVDGAGGRQTIRAGWLVGCDGGRSRVRKLAGFDFPGTDPTIMGHQAIVEVDYPERLLPLGWRRTAVGMMAYGPVPGRIFVVEFDGPPADRDAQVTREEVETSLRKVSGADVRVLSMQSGTRFTDNARLADSYRKGPVLLVGDAAHVHSPFGGQGLNLGLLDAVNLGFKLAAVARGDAPPDLLDSYTAERHPVAACVLANTRAQVALMRPDGLTTALRDVVTEIMRLDEGNRYFGELISGLRTRYDLGEAHSLVGTLAADREVGADGATLFELMLGGQAVLLDGAGGAGAEIAAGWGSRVTVITTSEQGSMLIRPDACIAWVGEDGSVVGLEAALTRWLGRPAGETGR